MEGEDRQSAELGVLHRLVLFGFGCYLYESFFDYIVLVDPVRHCFEDLFLFEDRHEVGPVLGDLLPGLIELKNIANLFTSLLDSTFVVLRILVDCNS